MLIGVDLTQTPDVRTVIKAGIYGFLIEEVDQKLPQKAETKGMNVVLGLRLTHPPDSLDAGRQMTHYVFIPGDSKRADAFTAIKRIFLSAGVPIKTSGMDTNDLRGKQIVAQVTNGTRKDEQSGMIKETYQISEVFIPGDPVKLGESAQAPGAPATVDTSAVLGGGTQAPPPPAPGLPTGIHPTMMPAAAPAAPPAAPIAPQLTPPPGALAPAPTGIPGFPQA